VTGPVRIVLVHGAGGSSLTWSLVAPLIEGPGREIVAVDNASQSLDDDVARVRAVLDAADDDALLVGHSYGGAVITAAGRHERVRGLVYVAAFAPAEGESVDAIVERFGPAEVFADAAPPADGVWLMPGAGDDDWQRHSWDVPPEMREAVSLRERRAIAEEIFTRETGTPAWARLPAWYLVATRDKHIRPDAQRAMAERAGATVAEAATSHSVPYAAPERVAALIETALTAVAR
jgi:pimeloyl-ACP methyl ester carboxylesterase